MSVDIVITRETTALTQAGFGLPLIVDTGGASDYTLCNDLSEVAEEFDSTTDVYKMAAALLGQEPAPSQVAVAGIDKANIDATATITSADGGEVLITADTAFSGATGNDKDWEIVDTTGGLAVTYATDTLTIDLGGADASAEDIAAEITLIDNFSAEVTNDGTFKNEDTAIGDFEGGVDDSVQPGLNTLAGKNNDWYFLLCVEQNEAEIAELSTWAAANGKLYIATPNETVADTATLAAALNSDRTALIYHDDSEKYADARWVGACAPFMPGALTWAFKQLAGIAEADISTTEINDLHNANVNTIIRGYGVNYTSNGKTTSGEYIDVIRSQDFIEARLQEGVMALLLDSPKVPFTTAGISQVEAIVESVMQLGVERQIIAVDADGNGMYTVTTPDINDVPQNDKANRHLADVKFSFILAGAVHSVRIDGVISI